MPGLLQVPAPRSRPSVRWRPAGPTSSSRRCAWSAAAAWPPARQGQALVRDEPGANCAFVGPGSGSSSPGPLLGERIPPDARPDDRGAQAARLHQVERPWKQQVSAALAEELGRGAQAAPVLGLPGGGRFVQAPTGPGGLRGPHALAASGPAGCCARRRAGRRHRLLRPGQGGPTCRHPELLDVALTFQDLRALAGKEDIDRSSGRTVSSEAARADYRWAGREGWAVAVNGCPNCQKHDLIDLALILSEMRGGDY